MWKSKVSIYLLLELTTKRSDGGIGWICTQYKCNYGWWDKTPCCRMSKIFAFLALIMIFAKTKFPFTVPITKYLPGLEKTYFEHSWCLWRQMIDWSERLEDMTWLTILKLWIYFWQFFQCFQFWFFLSFFFTILTNFDGFWFCLLQFKKKIIFFKFGLFLKVLIFLTILTNFMILDNFDNKKKSEFFDNL